MRRVRLIPHSGSPDRAASRPLWPLLSTGEYTGALVIVALASYFGIAEYEKEAHFLITLSLLSFLFWFSKTDAKVGLIASAPMLALVFVALLQSLLDAQLTRDTLKGLWYGLRIPVYLVFGAALSAQIRDLRYLLTAVVLAASAMAALYLYSYFDVLESYLPITRYILRSTLGPGTMLAVPAVGALLLNVWRGGDILPFRLGASFALLGLLLVFAYATDSRSLLVGIIVATTFVSGLSPTRRQLAGSVFVLALLSMVLSTPILSVFIPDNVLGNLSLQVPDFVNEVLPIQRYSDYDINNFWRGYETYNAFAWVMSKGTVATIFGTGLHTSLPLNQTLVVDGVGLVAIPIFHNGFSFVFFRAGVLGLALFLLLHVGLASRLILPRLRQISAGDTAFIRLSQAMLVTAVLLIPATAGLLNYGEPGATAAVLIGAGIARCAALPGRSVGRG